MLDFLAKFGVTIFFGLLSTVLATTFYFKNKKRKQISYEMISCTPILNKVNNKVKVYFEDKEIKNNLYMVSVKVANTGNQPIKKDDFNSELILKFFKQKGSFQSPFVFEANVNSKVPDDLDLEIYVPDNKLTNSFIDPDFEEEVSSYGGNYIAKQVVGRAVREEELIYFTDDIEDDATVAVKPMLLNPKEQFTLSLLVTEFKDFKLSTRIVGGNIIKVKEPIRNKFSLVSTEGISLSGFTTLFLTLISFLVAVLTLLLTMLKTTKFF